MTEDHSARTEAAQFAEVRHHITTAHSYLAAGPCRCTGEDNCEMCSARIACKAVPARFGDTDGSSVRYNEICTHIPLSVSQHPFGPLHTGEQVGHSDLDVSICKWFFRFAYTSR